MNRGITSIASDEMVQLLASFGLACLVTRLFVGNASRLLMMHHCALCQSRGLGVSTEEFVGKTVVGR